jgi:hypothetical protein
MEPKGFIFLFEKIKKADYHVCFTRIKKIMANI